MPTNLFGELVLVTNWSYKWSSKLDTYSCRNVLLPMFSSRWNVWDYYSSITGISLFGKFRNFFEINRYIKVVNGKIQYFVKGQRVKPSEYYKFRSEISNKKSDSLP